MYKGIIYCRVSTEKQEREGTSLDGQRESCLTKAKELGFEVSDDLIFTESFTGAELIRPELDRVRRLINDGEAQAIFCLDPDRLSRNFTHLMILANEFEKAGCELQFVTHQVGKTPEDRMLFGMKGLFGEYEREKI
jgi:site-specific DNA recombinase